MWPFKRPPSPAATTHAVPPEDPQVYSGPQLRRFRLRPGMWVVESELGAGILTGVDGAGMASVMLTDGDGCDRLLVNVTGGALRQAYFEEIPAARRPDAETALRMGYKMRNR